MRPLTVLGLTLRGVTNGTPKEAVPCFTLATSDAHLWSLQSTRIWEDHHLTAAFTGEDPFLVAYDQLVAVLKTWGVFDYHLGLALKPNVAVAFRQGGSPCYWILPVTFRPEGGNTYLGLRLYGSQEGIRLGPFTNPASARAWTLTAVSALSVAGARLAKEGWYQILAE